MDREQFLNIIKGGHFFSVKFIKRTTGDVRILNGRTGVHKASGVEPPRYSDEDYGLVTVWDVQKHGYRKIPADSILEVRSNKIVFKGEL